MKATGLKCNKCGQCCKHIYLDKKVMVVFGKSWFFGANAIGDSAADTAFMETNWIMIRKDVTGNGFIFYCKQLNNETKLCSVYGDRPNVCKYFPFYSKYKRYKCDASRLHEGCGYRLASLDSVKVGGTV